MFAMRRPMTVKLIKVCKMCNDENKMKILIWLKKIKKQSCLCITIVIIQLHAFIQGDVNSHSRRRDMSLKTKMIFCNRCFFAVK